MKLLKIHVKYSLYDIMVYTNLGTLEVECLRELFYKSVMLGIV